MTEISSNEEARGVKYSPGETLMLDRCLKVEFVSLNGPDAIVRYAGATHVVPQWSLSRAEG